MTPKGGIRPHKKFSIQANKSEILFLDYIIEHLSGTKKAGIIIPEGVLHNNYASYKSIREKLIKENLLYAVVELPHGVFKPYASVKTHILFVDKDIAKLKKDILFVQVENDGFTQTGARKPVKQNDLGEAKRLIETFKSTDNIESKSVKFNTVNKTEILNDKCLSLVGRRYKAIHYANSSNYPTRKLDKKLIKVFKGTSGAQSTEEGNYRFVVTAENFRTSKDYAFNCKAICVPIVSSTGHGHASVRRLHYIEGKFALANIMCGIEVLDEGILLPKYLYFILSAMKEEILASLMTGTSNVSLDKDDIYDIEIPCPEIEIQQKIIQSQLNTENEIFEMKKKIKANQKKLSSEGKKIWN